MAFLSGGQSGEDASARLNAMRAVHAMKAINSPALPWTLSFSFRRAIQHPALHSWAGQESNRVAAQRALVKRVQCNLAALKGEYSAAMALP